MDYRYIQCYDEQHENKVSAGQVADRIKLHGRNWEMNEPISNKPIYKHEAAFKVVTIDTN